MRMASERRIEATPEAVWRGLNDPEILRQSVPGCETIERLSETELAAEVIAKVGPVKARFAGRLTLSDLDPPHGYRISGEGQGTAGFARGGAVVRLRPDGGQTVLSYEVEATVGGKLAQLGSRLIDAAAGKFADDFFERFSSLVEPEPSIENEPTASPSRGLHPWVWVPGLIAIVLLFLYLFAQLRG